MMPGISPIEKEFLKATKFKGDKYPDRQDYLAALLQAIDKKLSNDDYDLLTDDAVAWHRNAVTAFESRDDIPDFEGADAADDSTLALTDPRHPLHRHKHEESEAPPDDGEDDNGGETAGSGPGEDEAPPQKATTKPAKPAKAKKAEKPPKVYKKPQPDYASITGEKDRYGVVLGTKTAKAVALYEKGVTMKDLEEELEGRYRNILKKLKSEGHKVEQLPGNVWKLTHRDDA